MRYKPEDDPFNEPLVATGTIRDADAVRRLGREGVHRHGSVRVQSERAVATVSGAGAADRTFQSACAELG